MQIGFWSPPPPPPTSSRTDLKWRSRHHHYDQQPTHRFALPCLTEMTTKRRCEPNLKKSNNANANQHKEDEKRKGRRRRLREGKPESKIDEDLSFPERNIWGRVGSALRSRRILLFPRHLKKKKRSTLLTLIASDGHRWTICFPIYCLNGRFFEHKYLQMSKIISKSFI